MAVASWLWGLEWGVYRIGGPVVVWETGNFSAVGLHYGLPERPSEPFRWTLRRAPLYQAHSGCLCAREVPSRLRPGHSKAAQSPEADWKTVAIGRYMYPSRRAT